MEKIFDFCLLLQYEEVYYILRKFETPKKRGFLGY